MHSLRSSFIASLCAATLLACGGPPAPTPPTAAPAATDATPAPTEAPASEPPATAPTPYTADQIRDASKTGREWQYRVVAGDVTEWSVMTMTAVDADGAMIVSSRRGGEGKALGEPKEGKSTWEDLRQHAVFPASTTTISDDTVKAPGGPYASKKYTVKVDGGTSTYWFANDLPGAPVKVTIEKGGAVVETRQLMKYNAGS
jgi:hypothetical protein